ncbi:MAG: hypothetical protein IJA97_06405 [Clostridia bacterium]|nr:hypothetical protein [Clostridia bacterium]
MIKKIICIFSIICLALLIPFSCSIINSKSCKAEEVNNIQLSSEVESNAKLYTLLGALPYQYDNTGIVYYSPLDLILYTEEDYGIFYTYLIYGYPTSNDTTAIDKQLLFTSGQYNESTNTYDLGREGRALLTIGYVSPRAYNNVEQKNITTTFSSFGATAVAKALKDSDGNQKYKNFLDIVKDTATIHRYSYSTSGEQSNHNVVYQFLDAGGVNLYSLYFHSPYAYGDTIRSYIYDFSPRSSINISDLDGGYTDGYNAGLSEGYNVGFEEGYNSKQPFDAIVTGVNEFMKIELLGGFTVGVMISMVLSLSFLFIGIKLMRR